MMEHECIRDMNMMHLILDIFNIVWHILIALLPVFLGTFFAFLFAIYREEKQKQENNISSLEQTVYILDKMYLFQKELRKFIASKTKEYLVECKNLTTSDNDEKILENFLKNFVEQSLPDKQHCFGEYSQTFNLPRWPKEIILNIYIMEKEILDWILGVDAAFQSVVNLLIERNNLYQKQSVLNSYESNKLVAITGELIRQNKDAIEDYLKKQKEFENKIKEFSQQKITFLEVSKSFFILNSPSV